MHDACRLRDPAIVNVRTTLCSVSSPVREVATGMQSVRLCRVALVAWSQGLATAGLLSRSCASPARAAPVIHNQTAADSDNQTAADSDQARAAPVIHNQTAADSAPETPGRHGERDRRKIRSASDTGGRRRPEVAESGPGRRVTKAQVWQPESGYAQRSRPCRPPALCRARRGRSQLRLASPAVMAPQWRRLPGPAGGPGPRCWVPVPPGLTPRATVTADGSTGGSVVSHSRAAAATVTTSAGSTHSLSVPRQRRAISGSQSAGADHDRQKFKSPCMLRLRPGPVPVGAAGDHRDGQPATGSRECRGAGPPAGLHFRLFRVAVTVPPSRD